VSSSPAPFRLTSQLSGFLIAKLERLNRITICPLSYSVVLGERDICLVKVGSLDFSFSALGIGASPRNVAFIYYFWKQSGSKRQTSVVYAVGFCSQIELISSIVCSIIATIEPPALSALPA